MSAGEKILQKSTDVRVESVAVSLNLFAPDFACEKGVQENGMFKNNAYNGFFQLQVCNFHPDQFYVGHFAGDL